MAGQAEVDGFGLFQVCRRSNHDRRHGEDEEAQKSSDFAPPRFGDGGPYHDEDDKGNGNRYNDPRGWFLSGAASGPVRGGLWKKMVKRGTMRFGRFEKGCDG
jgi:hypothetical protein